MGQAATKGLVGAPGHLRAEAVDLISMPQYGKPSSVA